MKIIYSSWMPPKGYSMIMLVLWLIVRKDCKDLLTAKSMRHEMIHLRQCREMLWLFFYLWYGVEWFVRALCIVVQSIFKLRFSRFKAISKLAYRNVSFEREAYDKQAESNCLKERSLWAWVRYLKK